MPKVRTECIRAKLIKEMAIGLNEIYAETLRYIALKYLIFAPIRIENHEVEEYLFCNGIAEWTNGSSARLYHTWVCEEQGKG
jgi:hypothetical protein